MKLAFRCFQNLKKLTLVDFGSDLYMGCLFYDFMKGHKLVCIRLTQAEHDKAFKRFLEEESKIGRDMRGFSMTNVRKDPNVPEATAFLAKEFRFLQCTHDKERCKYWTMGGLCGGEKFPYWYH